MCWLGNMFKNGIFRMHFYLRKSVEVGPQNQHGNHHYHCHTKASNLEGEKYLYHKKDLEHVLIAAIGSIKKKLSAGYTINQG